MSVYIIADISEIINFIQHFHSQPVDTNLKCKMYKWKEDTNLNIFVSRL